MATGKQLGRFEEALRRGHYLFHVHTNWTDAKSSLSDYCKAASSLGFQSIILTEHIRRKCTYDFQAFIKSVEEKRPICGVEIILGAEAKVLPGGSVDIPDEVLPEIEVLGIAEHSFEGNAATLADSLIRTFKSLRDAEFPRVWVHPGLGLLRKKHASVSLFQEVLHAALEYKVHIEFNLRYRLPPESFLSLSPSPSVVVGLDAHSVMDVVELAEEALYWQSQLTITSADWNKGGNS